MRRFRPLLLLAAAISFGLGISLPLLKLQKLWVFSETPSLIGVIAGLWQANDIALSFVVAFFSIIFPIAKMAITYNAVFSRRKPGDWASAISKWSLTDVMIVAILVFAAKTSGLATAISQPGIWFFGLSTVFTALATIGLRKA